MQLTSRQRVNTSYALIFVANGKALLLVLWHSQNKGVKYGEKTAAAAETKRRRRRRTGKIRMERRKKKNTLQVEATKASPSTPHSSFTIFHHQHIVCSIKAIIKFCSHVLSLLFFGTFSCDYFLFGLNFHKVNFSSMCR